ncbi:MAG: SDR family NAD(P)-dependent oxidoreductase [Deltaproteobacteria bacterium]|nr:SDR family NAD(P)-dependent oxidoreductase [Deltaproteobacteria bacterium]
MPNTIIIGGFGPGISKAVAEQFGAAGYQLALVGRSADRLAAGVAELTAKGLSAFAFPANLGDAVAVKSLVASVRKQLGPISAVHWNAYTGAAGDLMKADAAALHEALDIATVSLLTLVQEAHADLKASKGSVLITNGGLGIVDPAMDGAAVSWNAMGLALANAAKHKLASMLTKKLEADGIYVGEVMVHSLVKGTAFDSGGATLDPKTVGEKFFELHSKRATNFVNVS